MLTSQWQIAESKSVAERRHSYTLNVAVLNFKLLLVFSKLLAFCSVLHNSVSAICLHSNRRMGRTNASGYNNETLFQHCAGTYKSRHAVFAIYLRSCEMTQIACRLFYLRCLVRFGAVCCQKMLNVNMRVLSKIHRQVKWASNSGSFHENQESWQPCQYNLNTTGKSFPVIKSLRSCIKVCNRLRANTPELFLHKLFDVLGIQKKKKTYQSFKQLWKT